MNCTSFREEVHEIDRDDSLDASAYDAAVAHAQTCTRCARLLYQSRRLDTSLRALAKADEHREPSARLQGQLLREFRAQAPVRLGTAPAVRWLGIAAAVLILAGGALLVWRYARVTARTRVSAPAAPAIRSVPPQSARTNSAAAPAPPSPASVAVPLASALEPRSRAGRAAAAAQQSEQPEELEDLADFIPLPYADDDTPLGAGELVRVRLSESALGLLGFPVSDDSAAEPVTADVVIGEDGVARAIRFVSGLVPSELAQLRTTTFDTKGAKQP
jgi:hypothetical protein